MIPGGGYRRAEASTAAHVNWRQAKVAKDYARKAQKCDAAVPGDETPFTDAMMSYGEWGRAIDMLNPPVQRPRFPSVYTTQPTGPAAATERALNSAVQATLTNSSRQVPKS